MNISTKNIAFYFIIASFLAIISCNGSGEEEFNRTAFLEYYANDVLKSRMNDLSIAFERLNNAIVEFCNNPIEMTLSQARESYINAGLKWQKANFINFGPGAKDGLRLTLQEELALWPLNTSVIELKISNLEYALDDNWRNSRGLMTIEYLLYPNPDLKSSLDSIDQPRIDYLIQVANNLKNQVNAFNKDWTESYPNEFVANDGTDVKSSTTLLYNEWLRSFEVLKNMKIIEPLGFKAGQIGPEPELIESPYADLSLSFAKEHFNNIVEIYKGSETIGWDDYVRSVEGGNTLVDNALSQISIVQNAFSQVPEDMTFANLVEQEHPSLITLQEEMQNLLPYFKSEMSSLLGLAITFSSSDGD